MSSKKEVDNVKIQRETVADLLRGAIDLRIHAEPDLFRRVQDHMEVARQARDLGMRALVFKKHCGDTVFLAKMTNDYVGGIEVYGGLVLNYWVGGLNPIAVNGAINSGAREIWMPSIHSAESYRRYGGLSPDQLRYGKGKLIIPEKGLTIFDEKGNIKPEVGTILDLIADANIILSTAHLSVKEKFAIFEEAKKRGVKKMLITHPDVDMTVEEEKKAAKIGVYLERPYVSLKGPIWGGLTAKEMAERIRETGIEHCVMVSDLGQVDGPTYAAGMDHFIRIMLEAGIAKDDISVMIKDNPAKLLYQ